ncbi:MAG TPA: DNA translocase FtsK 4TM domain-containing protein, partial [Opitutus sp.]|nr:DNA translocase FtsK 4TM domain-containing protein [Opitutus sp.]
MPKSETSNSNGGPSFQAPRYRPNWLAAVVCFVLGPSLTVALVDYTPNQVTLNSTHATATNIVGVFGANSVWCALYTIGASTWLIPVFLFWMLYVAVRNPRRLSGSRLVAMLIAMVALSGLAAMFRSIAPSAYFPQGPGGLVGVLLYQRALEDAIGPFGSGLLLVTLYLCSLVFIFTKDVAGELERYLAAFHAWRDSRAKRKAELVELRAKARAEQAKQKAAPPPPPPAAAPIGPAAKKIVLPKTAEEPLGKPASAATAVLAPTLDAPPPKPEPKTSALRLAPKPASDTATDTKPLAVAAAGKLELNIVKPEETKRTKTAVVPAHSDDQNYQFPPLTILKEQVKPTAANSEEEHRRNAENLLRILSEFGV